MKKQVLIIVMFLFTNIFPKDSVFVYPSGREIEIDVNANVLKNGSIFVYNFEVVSGTNSIQNISEFFVESNSSMDSIISPLYWLGGISSVWTNIIMWGSRDTLYNILPGNSLPGFGYSSAGFPSIRNCFGVGYFELPAFELGEEPDDSEIVGNGVLENSVQGYTIGASSLPNPFIPLDFFDTLLTYTQRSLELQWITNQTTADKYNSLFTTAKTLLEGNHIPWVEYTLQSVIEECNTDSSGNITSEAYALLRYNTEYLLENLPEVIPPVLNSISPSLALPFDIFTPLTDLTVTALGEFFTDSSVVFFDGEQRTTDFVSDTVLTFQLNNSTDIPSVNNYPVWVSNYGSNSDTIFFSVVASLPQSITPTLQCVRNNGGGSFTAYFGYNNSNSETVFIAVGQSNHFTPGNPLSGWDRGQPKVFLPGSQTNVFSVNFNGDNLTWNLAGSSVTANKKSPACP